MMTMHRTAFSASLTFLPFSPGCTPEMQIIMQQRSGLNSFKGTAQYSKKNHISLGLESLFLAYWTNLTRHHRLRLCNLDILTGFSQRGWESLLTLIYHRRSHPAQNSNPILSALFSGLERQSICSSWPPLNHSAACCRGGAGGELNVSTTSRTAQGKPGTRWHLTAIIITAGFLIHHRGHHPTLDFCYARC